ncbi:MAG TPA: tRNA (adenosine(37)-N6)-dimethylallyltransferase MiaA [Gaiellaceae bacterium]|nr:tRNA (adenosine(37)-N6)-dimethylallyltransferase MiaA [Gaiellaceae bacterium]
MVVGLYGPTASGKTDVAEALADRLCGELVSADAMQAYGGLPILTNQSERVARLVGIWPLEREASVAEFQELAQAAVDEILTAGRTPVVVGGTGLYLRAALAALELPPRAPAAARSRLERLYDRLGPDRAHAVLADRDPAAAERVHANDRRRVVRALELAELGSSLAPSSDMLWGGEYRHPTLVIGLDVPRDVLSARIEARTSAMVERGVIAEARRALAGPVSQTALTIHGLRDFAELPLEEARETYNRRVRRYAAYQRKWMRRIPGVVIIDANRPATEVADEIVALARARERVPGDGAVRADG